MSRGKLIPRRQVQPPPTSATGPPKPIKRAPAPLPSILAMRPAVPDARVSIKVRLSRSYRQHRLSRQEYNALRAPMSTDELQAWVDRAYVRGTTLQPFQTETVQLVYNRISAIVQVGTGRERRRIYTAIASRPNSITLVVTKNPYLEEHDVLFLSFLGSRKW